MIDVVPRSYFFGKEHAMASLLKTAVVVVLGGVLPLAAWQASAAENGEGSLSKTEHVLRQAYLGVAVEPVHPGQISPLPKKFEKGQGLFVAAVDEDSPAESAGLKPHDVIMSYGNQKLFVPQQLSGLVRNAKSGQQVTLTILRDDKPMQITVTLGGHNTRYAGSPMERMFREMMRNGMPMRSRRMPNEGMMSSTSPEAQSGEAEAKRSEQKARPSGQEQTKETFDSMTIKNLGNDRYYAEIQYLDANGRLQSAKFAGTRKEIQRDIASQKNLPHAEQEQLLRSLGIPYEEARSPAVFWRLVRPEDQSQQRSDGVF